THRANADLQGPARRSRATADSHGPTGDAPGSFQLFAVRFSRDSRDRYQPAAYVAGRHARTGCPRLARPGRSGETEADDRAVSESAHYGLAAEGRHADHDP